MRIHWEGYRFLWIVFSLLTLINVLIFLGSIIVFPFTLLVSIVFFFWILRFFRHPERVIPEKDNSLIYAPANGKVVVIEESLETEFFQDQRLQVSIFMSPNDVHLNRFPVGGQISYLKHHPGKYLVAWHPKSSSENERTTIVIDTGLQEVLVRQIAGAVARRISTYPKIKEEVQQGGELGFIKFGSRVDLLLPLSANVKVKIGQHVTENQDIIAILE